MHTTSIHEDEQTLAGIDCRLRELELQHAIIQDQRISLSNSKKKISANIQAKRVGEAPMRSLIPELCGDIFALCVLGEYDDAKHSGWDIYAPVILSTVCRRWRDMIVCNPILWTKLCIRMDDKVNHIGHAKMWITRSGQIPIHISFCPSDQRPFTGIPDDTLHRFILVVKWMSQYITRAKTLTIRPGLPIIPFLLTYGVLPAMPHLSSLVLDTDDKDDASIVQCALEAPLLRQVRVRDLTSMTRILYRSLAHLHVLMITHSKRWANSTLFNDAMSSCTQLRECTITFPTEPINPPSTVIYLPELEHLHLVWPRKFDPSCILGVFRVPKLNHLQLSQDNNNWSIPRFALLPLKFLVDSAPELDRLTLSQCTMDNWYDLTSAIADAKKLSQLDILGCKRGSQLLMSLTPSPLDHPSTWLCARLRRLNIDLVDKGDVRPIIDFVRKRMNTGGDGTMYFEEIVLPRSMEVLDFQSRVFLLNQLRSIGDVGTVRISGCVF